MTQSDFLVIRGSKVLLFIRYTSVFQYIGIINIKVNRCFVTFYLKFFFKKTIYSQKENNNMHFNLPRVVTVQPISIFFFVFFFKEITFHIWLVQKYNIGIIIPSEKFLLLLKNFPRKYLFCVPCASCIYLYM